MKLTKKLIPAIGMLALSACMMVTSTFAWFSMNTEVSVNNLTVTAKGDQVYLQIVKSGADFVDGKSQTTYTYGAGEDADEAPNSKTYIPTNVYSSFNTTNPGAFKGTATDGALNLVWVTATSNDPAQSGKDGNGYTQVTTIANYAYKTSYDLRLDPKAGTVPGGTLKVGDVAFAGTYTSDEFASCVSVLIVCESEKMAILYKQTSLGNFEVVSGSAEALTADKFPASTLEQDNIKTIDIYVFFDGDNAVCKTANVTTTAYAVSVSFDVSADE